MNIKTPDMFHEVTWIVRSILDRPVDLCMDCIMNVKTLYSASDSDSSRNMVRHTCVYTLFAESEVEAI
ncbi:hypothetical protein K0M31_013298 [Melipona bicolor]|uniref:Uncharacterized protein n=1 Tax=Melipona bicolor TaxID=60889 RepID=A0AA40FI23_9HYME|nr:hypothetical protein K0M31_013298 [Melipona bicolor]